ncbi:MAG: hypothetical protein HY720_20765 [Planctomycetes bacterium]|nr:hypothetical protein [Planctomycetota bacterium]
MNDRLALFMLIALLVASPAMAQEEIDKPDATLGDLLQWARQRSEDSLRFVYPGELLGVELKASWGKEKPSKGDELIEFVRLVLQAHGYVLVPYDPGAETWRIWRVVRAEMARWQPTRFVGPDEIEGVPDAELVTCLVPLAYADPQEVQGALSLARIVDPQVGNVTGFESTRTLSISDYAANVRRVLALVRRLDIPRDSGRPSGVLTLSLRAWLFPGEALQDAPRASAGKAADDVLARASADSASALLAGTSGKVFDPTGGDSVQECVTRDGERSISIANHLVISAVDPQSTVPVSSPRIDLELRTVLPRPEGGGTLDVSASFSLPVSRPGTYAFLHTMGTGSSAVTLVVYAELREE